MQNENSTKSDKQYIKELEIALTQSEEKFNTLYNHSPDMYVAVSPKDGCVKFCNKTLFLKTGYKEEEIIGFPVFKLYHEDCIDEVKSAFADFVSTGVVKNKQLIIKCKDGHKIDVILNVVAVRDDEGNILYSTSSWRDITEELINKKHEIENEYLLLESQRIGKIGSWKIDLEDKLFSCSKEIYNIFEIGKGIKLTKYNQLIDYIHPSYKKTVCDSYEKIFKDSKPFNIEYTLLLKNDKIKYVQASSEPLYDPDGKIISLIGTIQDITYIKNIQKQLEEFNKNLELKVQEKTEKLALAIKQLAFSEKMASLGSLVTGIAHEINTPLGISLTASSHFSKITDEIKDVYKKDQISQDDFEEYLNTSYTLAQLVNTNTKKAADLIKSFKQIAVDQSNEEQKTFVFSEYLSETLTNLYSITKQKKVDIEVECDKSISINSYPGAFSQIINNLVLNSTIHGFAEKDNGHIVIKVHKEEDEITLTYTDDGVGVKKELLTKIFDPLFKANREFGGTGLGLHIVYSIVTNILKGTISCESSLEKGFKITISFKI